MMKRCCFTGSKGFSLAELLMVLLILGNIATFTIPKVINSQQASTQKAIHKEAVGAFSEVFYTGLLKGDINNSSNLIPYFQSKINAVKICNTDSYAQGCRTESTACNVNHPGMVLHNGATVVFWNGSNGRLICVDWNGNSPPNVWGQDELVLYANTNSSGLVNGVRYGQVGPDVNDASAVALFQNTFK